MQSSHLNWIVHLKLLELLILPLKILELWFLLWSLFTNPCLEYSRHVWADVSNMRPFCFLDISLVELSCFFFLIFVDGLFVTMLGWINFSSPFPHVIRVSTPAVTFWNHLPTEYVTLIYDLDYFNSAVIKHLASLKSFSSAFLCLEF